MDVITINRVACFIIFIWAIWRVFPNHIDNDGFVKLGFGALAITTAVIAFNWSYYRGVPEAEEVALNVSLSLIAIRQICQFYWSRLLTKGGFND